MKRVMQCYFPLFLCAAVAIGARSAAASPRAEADRLPPPKAPGVAGAAQVSGSPQPRMVPAGIVLKSKVSTDDDPHLPELAIKMYTCGSLAGTYKICVQPSGQVDTAEPVVGIPGADAQIIDQLKLWRFSALPKAACFLQQLEFQLPRPEQSCLFTGPPLVPQDWMADAKLSTGDYPQLPAGQAAPPGCDPLIGVYKLCTNRDGSVLPPTVVRGLASLDQVAIDALSRWRYRPIGAPVCTWQYIRFPEKLPELCPGSAAEEIPPQAKGADEEQTKSAFIARQQRISGDDPHLPDVIKALNRGRVLTGAYKICTAHNGTVSSIDPIRSLLRADEAVMQTMVLWRYKPAPRQICYKQFLEFHIE